MRPKQTLLLGLMLLLPVLAFLFLKTFGTNRYALPSYLPDRVDSTQVGGKWQRDTVFHQLGDFHLLSQAGRTVTQADVARGAYVAGFFSTSCPDTCAKVVGALARVQEAFRQEPQVKLVAYSQHPEADSVAALERYAEKYGAIAGKWFFLTGDKTALARLTIQDYRLAAAGRPSSNLYLVDRDKRVRGIYDATKLKEVNRLITEISVLLYTYDHNQPGS